MKKQCCVKKSFITFAVLIVLFSFIGVVSCKQSSKNPLLNEKLKEAVIKNNAGQDIGTRAYINLPNKVKPEDISLDDYTEFYNIFKQKNYNWVSIIFSNGKGVVFSGGKSLGIYAKIDNLGRLSDDSEWSIIFDEKTQKFIKNK